MWTVEGRKQGRSGRWLECCLSEPQDMLHPGTDSSVCLQCVPDLFDLNIYINCKDTRRMPTHCKHRAGV